ncbi:MAG: geranylgeranylglyceryl/heptaprenylglyceryl phosphate synthase [Flavobacteriales bacterium]|jgi:phosphoglycerol geranylgeranyltransferase|nr:geranylgeranylglyceryl/heptaprenylglyceryl phosphate synthase [Flavobacteriales bacterium]MDG2362770.1 geranylgeranylglyceryl/heptaprenylglyceryl phosphate synthase [Flavobacteriales bacterium]
MNNNWLKNLKISKRQNEKRFAVLLDPDKIPTGEELYNWLNEIEQSGATDILIGGSHLSKGNTEELVKSAKKQTSLPVVLFPGSPEQVTEHADVLLFLSLVSGRNADLLIGRHVEAAPLIMAMDIETIATAYLLVGDGPLTTAAYITQTLPIPSAKPELAVATASAAVLLGMQAIYLDAGSGAANSIPTEVVSAVSNAVDVPVIVGGGIRDFEGMERVWAAGADLVVLGTVLEKVRDFSQLTPS